jgi:hypothetical protein
MISYFKYLVLLIALSAANAPVANAAHIFGTEKNSYTQNTRRKPGKIGKDGRYRKKKGFMWGLFAKKKGCDCPET